ncbi:MAG: tRNA (cytidine(34)-2'-O)-methyltransferase [Deltaproteobacteria bacterium]|nr:tRNA (cytidine(34)-2'-O)-methyltransferase [Deltaproteobacteria bacterium]
MEITLYQPLIPQNVGAIARTCAATGTLLNLIKPFPFELTEKRVKRAGLDYWHLVRVSVWESWTEYWNRKKNFRHWLIETPGNRNFFSEKFDLNDIFIFGNETQGVDSFVRDLLKDCLYIPVVPETVRSLNLSNCVAIVVYECLRQNQFRGISI